MRKLLKLFIFLFFFSVPAMAQSGACGLRISVLTCSPGEELYSTFGHTAVRVQDSTTGSDYVFNYGTFEFGPDFYAKFIQGKLRYYVSIENFNDFLYSYQWESRSVVAQELQLSCAEKQRLAGALQNNAREENRYYLYDFLFDNCTTRPKNIIAANTMAPVTFGNILPPQTPTFRNLIHEYLDRGGQYWSKAGIDLLLGARLDKKVTNEQAMFLPDYFLKGLNAATLRGAPLVTPPQPVLQMPSPLNKGSLLRPSVVFSALLLLALVLFFTKKRWAAVALKITDFLLFFTLGLGGIILLYMWWGTDHLVTKNNYNLLWALPTHAVIAFFFHKEAQWVKTYFKATFLITALLLLTWAILPQQLNTAFIPLLLLVLFRSGYYAQNEKSAGKRNRIQQ